MFGPIEQGTPPQRHAKASQNHPPLDAACAPQCIPLGTSGPPPAGRHVALSTHRSGAGRRVAPAWVRARIIVALKNPKSPSSLTRCSVQMKIMSLLSQIKGMCSDPASRQQRTCALPGGTHTLWRGRRKGAAQTAQQHSVGAAAGARPRRCHPFRQTMARPTRRHLAQRMRLLASPPQQRRPWAE